MNCNTIRVIRKKGDVNREINESIKQTMIRIMELRAAKAREIEPTPELKIAA